MITPGGGGVTYMSAEFGGVPEKIHGFVASHSLCYQCLAGGQGEGIII